MHQTCVNGMFSRSFRDLEFYNLDINCMQDHVHLFAFNLLINVMPPLLSLTIYPVWTREYLKPVLGTGENKAITGYLQCL